MSTTFLVERFIIPVRETNNRPSVFVAVKKYTPRLLSHLSAHHSTQSDVSLLLTHGVTFHKELWEPTLAGLFDHQHQQSGSSFRIREAWAIDCPNHGESSHLNDRLISSGVLLNYRDYARAVLAFLESGLLDVRHSRIVAMGHSAGTAPLIWAASQWYQAFQRSPFSALILLEPPIISAHLDAKYNHFNSRLAARAQRRRDTWSSKEEANMWVAKQQQKWDPHCAALFKQFGLQHNSNRSVSLSCNGAQEAACYDAPAQDEVLNVLKLVCAQIPVHTIFSQFLDLSPNNEIRENIVDKSQGRIMASVTWMPAVGHFAPIENPRITSHAVAHCLTSIARGSPSPSPFFPNPARL